MNNLNKRNIIIDCDPGIDDTIAIMLAAANHEKLNILGITTVTGNLGINKVTGNALKLVAFLNRNIPVAQGADTPLIREKKSAEHIHGTTGIGNYVLPETDNRIVKEHAVEFMKNTIVASDKKVTLVPIGPLTNIALLLKVYPEVKENIEEIVLMGGAIYGGNVTSTAEFNIWADPEAAQIVFASGMKIVMNGLDVTHSTGLNRNDVNSLLASEKKYTKMCGEILDFYFQGDRLEEKTFSPIHDASAIMYLLHEEIYTYRYMPVRIDLSEGLNRGMTVGDNREWFKYDDSHVKVLKGVDRQKFKDYLIESINKLDGELI